MHAGLADLSCNAISASLVLLPPSFHRRHLHVASLCLRCPSFIDSASGRGQPSTVLCFCSKADDPPDAQVSSSPRGEDGAASKIQRDLMTPSKRPTLMTNTFEKEAAAYKSKSKSNADLSYCGDTSSTTFSPGGPPDKQVPSPPQQDGISAPSSVTAGLFKNKQESEMVSALTGQQVAARGPGDAEVSDGRLEVEIITRDGIIRRKVARPSESFSRSVDRNRSGFLNKKDFMGLDFSEKKPPAGRQRPPGLAVGLEPPLPGANVPQVEIITRDGSKGEGSKSDSLYKPKVSTWGVFERPANISETYGGGRTIRPGEQLETIEEKEAREAHTRQLLDVYRKKAGLDVDPNIKSDSMKALKQGGDLMAKGKMQSAIAFFEKVMQQMPYQSELHGLAALQWSVCVDSLNRFQDARSMYKKISSHPNLMVRKKAKQLLFGFQAMDTLKISKTGAPSDWDSTPYRKYFDALAKDGYNNMIKSDDEDDGNGVKVVEQTLLYLSFLLSPILFLFFIILLRSKST